MGIVFTQKLRKLLLTTCYKSIMPVNKGALKVKEDHQNSRISMTDAGDYFSKHPNQDPDGC